MPNPTTSNAKETRLPNINTIHHVNITYITESNKPSPQGHQYTAISIGKKEIKNLVTAINLQVANAHNKTNR